MIDCVIIDDEPLAIEILQSHVEKTEGLRLAKIFTNAFEALYYVQTKKVDLIFLDIEMPGVNGIQFIKILKYPPKIIITSAHNEFALPALELQVVDYLLKPISHERFLQAFGKVLEQEIIPRSTLVAIDERSDQAYYFYAKMGASFIKIFAKDILFVKAERNYSILFLTNKKITLIGCIGIYTAKLGKKKFMRIHKSYTISLDCIEKLDQESVWLQQHKIPIGKNYRAKLFKYLDNFKI